MYMDQLYYSAFVLEYLHNAVFKIYMAARFSAAYLVPAYSLKR